MRISVVVPTFRRPDDLRRCLVALGRQSRRADQVVVVTRGDDVATQKALDDTCAPTLPLKVIVVTKPGMVHALACGLAAVDGDIVAFTDDDAAPHVDWLERIEQVFLSGAEIGGVGGRDMIGGRELDVAELRPTVGKVQWFGRVIGNHHIGCGPARRVDLLKGVNSTYRTKALRQVGFDSRLRGQGAQVHSELDIGLGLMRCGWTLVYDPKIRVDHFPAPRHAYDQRHTFHPRALSEEVHNETMVLLRHLPPLRRAVYVVWFLLCGTRSYPGVLCWLVEAARGKSNASHRFIATLRGRCLGTASWFEARPWQPTDVAVPPAAR